MLESASGTSRKPDPALQEALRQKIRKSLRKQGFGLKGGRISVPRTVTKDLLRGLHATAVSHRREDARPQLARYEERLLEAIADGNEVAPDAVCPELVEVARGSDDELLFRYASRHWSIPTSAGYGRRLRFLVKDRSNGKLIGLFGLCDPIFSMADRDMWIGWSFSDRRERLRHVMEAFILGAVPPYTSLLCGKLVAMLATSDEVRACFRRKYGRKDSLISAAPPDGRLAALTTTSALGRSSIYNRVRFGERCLFQSVGFTKGWGEFQFSNGLYSSISEYANEFCIPTAKHAKWGGGFRNRREVVKKCLASLGFSDALLNHGVKRELFFMPLATNSCAFLRGEHRRLRWHHQPAVELFEYFRTRWLLPRASRDDSFAAFDKKTYRLWPEA